MKCSCSANQLAGMEVGGDTPSLTVCPHSQLTPLPSRVEESQLKK